MSDSISDEPALQGVGSGTTDGGPYDALGNEPALQGDRPLPDYGEVYRQFRAETPASWGTAAVVAMLSTAITVGVMVVPIGLMLARLFDRLILPVTFAGFGTYLPAVIGALLVAPALVWVEVRPWTVPNALALGGSAAGPGVLAGLWLAAVGVTHASGSLGVVAVAFLALIVPAGLCGLGVVHVWRRVDQEGEIPVPGRATPFAVAAGIVAMIGAMTAWQV